MYQRGERVEQTRKKRKNAIVKIPDSCPVAIVLCIQQDGEFHCSLWPSCVLSITPLCASALLFAFRLSHKVSDFFHSLDPFSFHYFSCSDAQRGVVRGVGRAAAAWSSTGRKLANRPNHHLQPHWVLRIRQCLLDHGLFWCLTRGQVKARHHRSHWA